MTSHKEVVLHGPHFGLAGQVDWAIINSDGSVAEQGGHKNLILDNGLDMLVATDFWGYITLSRCSSYCAVGIGNSTPIVSQLALDNEKARTANYLISPAGSCGTFQTDLNTVVLKRTFDFPLGALDSSIDGPYAEVGFSPHNAAGNNLFSRSLFKDGGGTPIAVSVSSSQQLRVTYSLTITFNLSDWVDGTASITGVGSVPYKVKAQMLLATPSPNPIIGSAPQAEMFSVVLTSGAAYVSGYFPPYMEPGAVAQVTSGNWCTAVGACQYADHTAVPPTTGDTYISLVPTVPTELSTSTPTPVTYVNGTFYLDQQVKFNLSQANFSISWLTLPQAHQQPVGYSVPVILLYFPTPIVKDNLHTLTLVLRRTWGRI